MPINTPDTAVSTKSATRRAAEIYNYAHYSASSLLAAFDLARESRGRPRGMTTDQEQDILRAMLVMACAGLDATIKQLIKDALPHLSRAHEGVRKGLEKFIARKIKGDEEATTPHAGAQFLARILSAPAPRRQVIADYVYALTGDSLQSHEQVLKAAAALGIPEAALAINIGTLKAIFGLRNMIIHELDITFDDPRRRRNLRREADMTGHVDEILRIACEFVRQVDGLLP